MKLNIGCGERKLEGYVNVDCRPEAKPDICCDVFGLVNRVPAQTVESIVAHAFVEHISWRDQKNLFLLFRRLLRPNGLLTITVPDLDDIVTRWQSGAVPFDWVMKYLYGAQTNPANFHKVCFTQRSMSSVMHFAGFKQVTFSKEGNLMKVEARRG